MAKAAAVFALACALAYAPVALGKRIQPQATPDVAELARPHSDVADTVTWMCTDLNDLLRLQVSVVLARMFLEVPAGISPPCVPTPFPVVVPANSDWAIGNFDWYTNTHYPDEIRAALAEMGYQFVSANPTEDLMMKLVEIRYVVDATPESGYTEGIAVFTFDPRKVFRLFRLREYYGDYLPDVLGPPPLGMTVEEAGRLPGLAFPGVAGPVPPGPHRVFSWWKLSATHNDGLGFEPFGNTLPQGEFLMDSARFVVAE